MIKFEYLDEVYVMKNGKITPVTPDSELLMKLFNSTTFPTYDPDPQFTFVKSLGLDIIKFTIPRTKPGVIY
jgi:hypothetical protein